MRWPLAFSFPKLPGPAGRFLAARPGDRRHLGIDVGKRGDMVVAAATGVVRYVGTAASAGNFIEIEHPGGWKTRYMHLEPFNTAGTKRGDLVSCGMWIGTAGSSGIKYSAPHLHWEVWHNGKPVDPLDVLEGEQMSYGMAVGLGIVVGLAVIAGLHYGGKWMNK